MAQFTREPTMNNDKPLLANSEETRRINEACNGAPKLFSYPKPSPFTEEESAYYSRYDEHIAEVLARQKKRGLADSFGFLCVSRTPLLEALSAPNHLGQRLLAEVRVNVDVARAVLAFDAGHFTPPAPRVRGLFLRASRPAEC